jgi:hypothetical protein
VDKFTKLEISSEKKYKAEANEICEQKAFGVEESVQFKVYETEWKK